MADPTVTHADAADGSFSATGATNWQKNHVLTGLLNADSPTFAGLTINGTATATTFSGGGASLTGITGKYVGSTVILSGTTTFTTGATTTKIRVRMQAAGGAGGGGATAVGSAGVGSGGSAGGYAEKVFTVAPSTGYTCAVGTGGTAGTAGNNPGNAGGNTTFQVGATTVTCNGGLGGLSQAAASSIAFVNGVASPAISVNGDLNTGGAPGGWALRLSATVAMSGTGGSSPFGAGGLSRSTQGTGNAGVGFGAGGAGGACINNGGDVAGGAGLDGVIIVDEYT